MFEKSNPEIHALNSLPARDACELYACPPSANRVFSDYPQGERTYFFDTLPDRLNAGVVERHREPWYSSRLIKGIVVGLTLEGMLAMSAFLWLYGTGRL